MAIDALTNVSDSTKFSQQFDSSRSPLVSLNEMENYKPIQMACGAEVLPSLEFEEESATGDKADQSASEQVDVNSQESAEDTNSGVLADLESPVTNTDAEDDEVARCPLW